MVIMTYLAVIVSIMILFFDTPYKRLEAERLTPDPTAATNNTASSSSSSHGSVSPRSSASSFHSLTESGRALRGGGGGGGGGRREEERVEDQGDCGGQDGVERSRL